MTKRYKIVSYADEHRCSHCAEQDGEMVGVDDIPPHKECEHVKSGGEQKCRCYAIMTLRKFSPDEVHKDHGEPTTETHIWDGELVSNALEALYLLERDLNFANVRSPEIDKLIQILRNRLASEGN